MEISLFLAQFFGLIYLVVGAMVIIRRSIVEELAERLIARPLMMWVAGALAYAIGLLIVLSHNVWDTLWQALISLIGWAYILEGIAYMLMPKGALSRFVRQFNTPAWYIGGGTVAIVLGLYLSLIGFGLL